MHYYCTHTYEPGDIVIVEGGGLISRLIRRFTPGASLEDVEASHVGIFTDRYPAQSDARSLEALGSGVKYRDVGRKDGVLVVRPVNVSHAERMQIANKAKSYFGRSYGYHKLGVQLLDSFLGNRLWRGKDVYLARRLLRMDRYPICSWVVAKAYSEVGKHFGVEPNAATPHDIHRYVARPGSPYRTVSWSGDWSWLPAPWQVTVDPDAA